MHDSSIAKAKLFIEKYLNENEKLSIIDVGSLDINGSYKNLFSNKKWNYKGADIVEGNNVDIVLDNPVDWSNKIKSNSADVVISGQALEHIKFMWKAAEEIFRILKPNGLTLIIVPSVGAYHTDIDYWRMNHDGLIALAEWSGLEVIDASTDFAGGWLDSWMIARKPDTEKKQSRIRDYNED